jgi:hypothetical protein
MESAFCNFFIYFLIAEKKSSSECDNRISALPTFCAWSSGVHLVLIKQLFFTPHSRRWPVTEIQAPTLSASRLCGVEW